MAINKVDLQDKEGNSYLVMANPDSKAEFTQAAARTNISSGETYRSIFGKIARYFADLKAVAFSGSYADLTNKPAIPSGAAADYQVANNDTTNSDRHLATAKVAYEHGNEIDKLNRDLVSNVNALKNSWLGGNQITFDGSNFWVTSLATGTKKKLGSGVSRIVVGKANNRNRTAFPISGIYGDYQNLTLQNFAFSSCGATKRGAQGQNDTTRHWYSLEYASAAGTLTCIPRYNEEGPGYDRSGEGRGSGPDIDEPDIILFAPEM